MTTQLTEENLGYGRANNIGIKISTTTFILNPDVNLNHLIYLNFVLDIAAPTVLDEFKNFREGEKVKEVKYVKGFAMLLNKNLYFMQKGHRKQVNIKFKVPILHLGGASHGDKAMLEMENSRNWHWMWSKFYFKKKYHGYLFALISTLPSFFSSITKVLFYSLLRNETKKNIYKMRFFGLINSYFLKKSHYRPKIY